jgi:hypothetical protein
MMSAVQEEDLDPMKECRIVRLTVLREIAIQLPSPKIETIEATTLPLPWNRTGTYRFFGASDPSIRVMLNAEGQRFQ